MPNHVTNTIRFNGSKEDVERIMAFVKSDESEFDFNKIIPMPEELNVESGSRGEDGLEAYREYLRTGVQPKEITNKYGYKRTIEDETFELGKRYYDNIKKYGCTTWYDWCWNNWGTKWNAYDIYVGDGEVIFNTAWNAPENVIRKLSELFQNVEIEHDYADEDIGYNCGKLTYISGEQYDDTDFEDGSDEAIRFACEVTGYDYEEYMEDLRECYADEGNEEKAGDAL